MKTSTRRFDRLVILAALVSGPVSAQAANIALFELGILKDEVVVSDVPSGGSFDPVTGLGSIMMSFSTPGSHQGGVYVDHELSESLNTFFNELGSVHGSVPAGLSWEIDEPGFSSSPGDIYDHVLRGSLDNSVGKSGPDDVAMALAWSFALQPGETGSLSFLLSTEQPSGFHLRHSDPDSGESVYFSAALRIVPPTTSVADGGGGTSLVALAAMALIARWRFSRQD